MTEIAELVTRARIADPPPAYCLGCLQSPREGLRFVDFQAVAEIGQIIDPTSGAVLDDLRDLVLCEDCFRHGAEVLDFKPVVHAAHRREVRRLSVENERLEEENTKLRSLVARERT